MDKKILNIIKQRFGNIPPDFITLLSKLEKYETVLKNAELNSTVTPSYFNNIAEIKAELFDFMNRDGIIIIGFLNG